MVQYLEKTYKKCPCTKLNTYLTLHAMTGPKNDRHKNARTIWHRRTDTHTLTNTMTQTHYDTHSLRMRHRSSHNDSNTLIMTHTLTMRHTDESHRHTYIKNAQRLTTSTNNFAKSYEKLSLQKQSKIDFWINQTFLEVDLKKINFSFRI